ncbi:hypothetical protein GGQ68_000578 [Sagittula marina]|uniref:M23ase beta-sheet core domain-containing protein n=1 Tax=Sagittula marina TaxID=943940 RepID=A0A7W6DP16_9RHOB|nr:M23 family metallopeptidase [Sagittula marina]MBB3984267.1 hypothetical protein [Sagittula marina]
MRRFLLFLLLPFPALAQPQLALPLDCEIGTTCFIEDYVDNDPRVGAQRDFACGINSRDGHKGTDIALLSFDAPGTAVTAAAPGTVVRTRDSMADDRLMNGVTTETACGNAVLVDHGAGWQTIYCHLALGSVRVAAGQSVERGTPLGDVGLSGQTNHPHLHFGVLHDGETIDPFRPMATGTCDETPTETLWNDPPSYTQTGLITAGFSDHIPNLDTVRDGSARVTQATADAPVVVYAHAGYAQHGDILRLSATGPDGQIFEHDQILKSPQISILRAYGRKAPATGWPTGDYLGEATLTRKGKVIAHRFAHVTVT